MGSKGERVAVAIDNNKLNFALDPKRITTTQ